MDRPGARQLVVGIDASNLRQGGGLTHLTELLRSSDPTAHGINRVVVWSGKDTLAALEERSWLEKVEVPALNGGFFRRSCWQRQKLSKAAYEAGCDLLFVPGGNFAGDFRPVVTMSRNLLPFEMSELLRYGWSFTTLRLLLLRQTQSRTFRSADGVIFLTRYAQQVVSQVTGPLSGLIATIPHGISPRFLLAPRLQLGIGMYSVQHPFRLLYVSIIDQYKHQDRLVEALAVLRRRTGWPLRLDLVGPAYAPALRRLHRAMNSHDPQGMWITYHGPVPYRELHRLYARADLGVFASSCENMPNILVETMAAGLPVACSARGPMREILGTDGVYFDPERVGDMAEALERLIASPELRSSQTDASFARSQSYDWSRCAAATMDFLAKVASRHAEIDLACAAS